MRNTGILLLMVILTTSCEKEVPMVKFRIELSGFVLEQASDAAAGDFPSFSHRLADGLVKFTSSSDSYTYNTKNLSEETYFFELPEGDYQLEFKIPQASIYGQEQGSYAVRPQTVHLTEETGILRVEVESTCALFLVSDEFNQLDKGIYIIERHSYANGHFTSYPLSFDLASGLYYSYFTPDPVPEDPSAFLWFYKGEPGEEQGGIPTADLEIGLQYRILILE